MDDWARKRLAELEAAAPRKRRRKGKYVHVPLPWGYRAFAIAGRGAPIVLRALHEQGINGRGDVKITAAFLKRYGIDRKTRSRVIEDLVAAGMATVRRRGKKSLGCPLLTMLPPRTTKGTAK
jgi:hypothetical protein